MADLPIERVILQGRLTPDFEVTCPRHGKWWFPSQVFPAELPESARRFAAEHAGCRPRELDWSRTAPAKSRRRCCCQ